MDEPKQSPFKLNRGRVLILVLGALALVIGISTWFGGINAYQQLREANAEATSRTAADTEPTLSP